MFHSIFCKVKETKKQSIYLILSVLVYLVLKGKSVRMFYINSAMVAVAQ